MACGSRAVDGNEEPSLEGGLGAQKTGVQEFHDRPEVAHVVFHRRAGQGEAVIRLETPGGPGLLGFRVFDVLGFIQDDPGPGNFLQGFKIAVQQGIT